MILDIILIVIVAINVLLGFKRGLLVMLGRLIMLVLIVAVALLVVGPLTDALAAAPFMASIEKGFGDAVLEPLKSSVATIDSAVTSLGLPPALAALIRSQLPSSGSSLNEGYAEFTNVLFKFALNAIIFIILFILIILLVSVLTKALTKAADKVPVIGPANHVGGLVLGLAVGLLQICVILLAMGFITPYFDFVAKAVSDSWLAARFYEINILSLIM